MEDPTSASFTVWKRMVFISLFFLITPIALVTSLVSLFTLQPKENEIQASNVPISNIQAHSGVQVYASLPSELPSISGQVLGADARGEILRQYLDDNNSPMLPYAEFTVQMADKYDLDYRLTTAIAKKESGMGKRMPSDDCYNPYGYGIHSEGTLCFDNWEEAIEIVSKGIKENYVDLGYDTVDKMWHKWVPISPDGVWATDVQYFIDQME